jgi:hypothetical protein
MKNIKVGIDAFNDLAKSHDAHVKEVERLQKELDELKKLKLVNQDGELLLECKIGDKHHQLLLEVGLNTILEKFIKIKEEKEYPYNIEFGDGRTVEEMDKMQKELVGCGCKPDCGCKE